MTNRATIAFLLGQRDIDLTEIDDPELQRIGAMVFNRAFALDEMTKLCALAHGRSHD